MGAFQSQPNGYACGTLSLINAANCLGATVDYDTAKSLAGTTSRYGTDRIGMIRAITGLGFTPTVYRSSSSENGWRYIRRWASESPIILLVDHHQHYVVVSGSIGDRVIVIDSGANIKGNEMGSFPYSKQELLDRWVHRGRVYAIRVS